MAKYDVYALRRGAGPVVDCQSNLNNGFDTRVVVPLVRRPARPPFDRRINPAFAVGHTDYVFAVQALQTVPIGQLGVRVTSLADHDVAITGAIDRLLFGI